MKLFLCKTKQELEHSFKVSFSGDTSWENSNEDKLYTAGAPYPIISNERPVHLQLVHWGFPLYLDEDQTILKNIGTVGIESVLEKVMFECIRTKRCLVPFETKETNSLQYGAGIWDIYPTKKGLLQKHFTLLTTKSTSSSQRVPFVLEGKAYKLWLNEAGLEQEVLVDVFGKRN